MTRFTDLVGCRYPLQLAAMGGIATPELAAAVTNAGGLGMLGIGRRPLDTITAMLDAVDDLALGPVGAGLIVEFLEPATLELVVERSPIVEFFWGRPDSRLVPDDRIVGWQIGSVDEALQAADAGCDFVVAQGVEAGGHVRGSTALAELLPAVRRAVDDDVAVVGAGGIGTAADVRAVIAMGADAVRVGSRFVATNESAAHNRYVELLIESSGTDTELSEAFWVGWPDAQHRVLTSAVEASGEADDVVGHMPFPDGTMRKVPRFFVAPPTRDFTGSIDAMALYAGMGIDAITARVDAASVVAELMQDGT